MGPKKPVKTDPKPVEKRRRIDKQFSIDQEVKEPSSASKKTEAILNTCYNYLIDY